MGKMPFAGFIGACSLGIMLTGCNCCDKQNQGTRSTYAGGLADKGMGITKPKRSPSTGTDLASKAGDYVMPPSYNGAPAAANSLASNSMGSAGTYRTAAAPPGNYGNIQAPSGNASLQPSIGSGMTASANPTIPGGIMPSSISNISPTSLSSSGAGNNRLSSSPIQPPPIQQVSGLMTSSPSVKTASFSSAGGDPSLPLPVKGANAVMIPPPPNTLTASIPPPNGKASSSTTNSTNSNSSSAPSVLPLPPNSISGALNAPSQPGIAGSITIAPNSGTTSPTSSSSPSVGAMPSYLNR